MTWTPPPPTRAPEPIEDRRTTVSVTLLRQIAERLKAPSANGDSVLKAVLTYLDRLDLP